MKLQRALSLARQAIDDYQMILPGDKIAIGMSGGKDSLTLLYVLKELQRFYPNKFTLEAITVDLGFGNTDFDAVRTFCIDHQVDYHVVKTDIGPIIFEQRKEKNPCSLCAKMRKGALNDKALSLGCNKIAYGHHRDDMIDTMMMSLIYEGHFYAFPPVTQLDKTGLTVLRPLMYMQESEIIGFSHKYQLPIAKSPCPANKKTKREYVKSLVRQINRENPGAADKMFTAILNGEISDWPEAVLHHRS